MCLVPRAHQACLPLVRSGQRGCGVQPTAFRSQSRKHPKTWIRLPERL